MHQSPDISTKTLIVDGAGALHKLSAYNKNDEDCWLYAYDADSLGEVTVGTTPRLTRLLVPAGSDDARGGNGEDFEYSIAFRHGLVLGVKTVSGSNPANPLEVEVTYSTN